MTREEMAAWLDSFIEASESEGLSWRDSLVLQAIHRELANQTDGSGS